MATLVQTIITLAFEQSGANDDGVLASDAEAAAHLDRIYQAYCGLLAVANRDLWLDTAALTWAGSPATVSLAEGVTDLVLVETAAGQEVTVVPVQDRRRAWVVTPACYRLGLSLVSLGRAGDPADTDTGTLWARTMPATLVSGGTLDSRFPKRHEWLLVLELALWLARKDTGRAAAETAALVNERDQHLKMFYAVNGLPDTARSAPHPPETAA